MFNVSGHTAAEMESNVDEGDVLSLRKNGIKLSAVRRWDGKNLEMQQSLILATATRRKVEGGRKEGDETTARFPFSVPSRRLTTNMLNYCFLPTCLVPSRTRAHSNNIHSLGKWTPNGSSYKLTKSVCLFHLERIVITFLYLFSWPAGYLSVFKDQNVDVMLE